MSQPNPIPNNDNPQEKAALDRPVTVTRFPDQWAKTKRAGKISLRKLADQIRAKKAATKAELPFLKLSSFGDKPTAKNCLRNDANVLAVDGVEGDHDAETMTPEEARDRLAKAGVAALIYTTPSHSPEAPRWRVMAPFSGPLIDG